MSVKPNVEKALGDVEGRLYEFSMRVVRVAYWH